MSTDIAMTQSPTLEAAKSILNYMGGDATSENKADYLAYRMSGFSFREACKLAGIHQATVQRWRGTRGESQKWADRYARYADPEFVEAEKAVAGPERAQLRKEIQAILFTRNYHLVLRKDHELLMKFLEYDTYFDDKGVKVVNPLSDFEKQYLLKARSYYTPQQAEIIEKLMDKEEEVAFNFSEFVMKLTRGADEVEIHATR